MIEREVEHIKEAVRSGKATDALLKMLADLPRRGEGYIQDLEALMAKNVGRGKEVLASLGTEILVDSVGTAEIRGDLREALPESKVLWLGEEDSNPR